MARFGRMRSCLCIIEHVLEKLTVTENNRRSDAIFSPPKTKKANTNGINQALLI